MLFAREKEEEKKGIFHNRRYRNRAPDNDGDVEAFVEVVAKIKIKESIQEMIN